MAVVGPPDRVTFRPGPTRRAPGRAAVPISVAPAVEALSTRKVVARARGHAIPSMAVAPGAVRVRVAAAAWAGRVVGLVRVTAPVGVVVRVPVAAPEGPAPAKVLVELGTPAGAAPPPPARTAVPTVAEAQRAGEYVRHGPEAVAAPRAKKAARVVASAFPSRPSPEVGAAESGVGPDPRGCGAMEEFAPPRPRRTAAGLKAAGGGVAAPRADGAVAGMVARVAATQVIPDSTRLRRGERSGSGGGGIGPAPTTPRAGSHVGRRGY